MLSFEITVVGKLPMLEPILPSSALSTPFIMALGLVLAEMAKDSAPRILCSIFA